MLRPVLFIGWTQTVSVSNSICQGCCRLIHESCTQSMVPNEACAWKDGIFSAESMEARHWYFFYIIQCWQLEMVKFLLYCNIWRWKCQNGNHLCSHILNQGWSKVCPGGCDEGYNVKVVGVTVFTTQNWLVRLTRPLSWCWMHCNPQLHTVNGR